MIIQYDTRPNATIDEKLRSLIDSIMLAFGEVGIKESNNITSQDTDMAAVLALIRDLTNEVASYSDAITGIDGRVVTLEDTTVPGIDGRVGTLEETTIPAIDERVTILEGQQPLPAAPGTDGTYKLTVTVTDGVPVYTWELA